MQKKVCLMTIYIIRIILGRYGQTASKSLDLEKGDFGWLSTLTLRQPIRVHERGTLVCRWATRWRCH